MSTRTAFDLDGLKRAIESGDVRYRAALYADRAEVRIFDANHPDRTSQSLHGRPAILEWLHGLYRNDDVHRVVESASAPDNLTLVEEHQRADGVRVVYVCSAELCRGQITSETDICNEIGPTSTSPRSAAPPPAAVSWMVDEDLSDESSSRPPPNPPTSMSHRRLPGYYFG